MNKRVFICAERKFPKIEAASNRIEYNAKALQEQGYEVIVLGIGENFKRDYCNNNDKYVFNDIEYYNVSIDKSKRCRSIRERFFLGELTVDKLKKYNLSSEDTVIIYSSNYFYSKKLLSYSVNKIGSNAMFDVVEWFQPFQFKGNVLNPSYWFYYICFHKLYKYTKQVLVISKNLKNYFENKGCEVCLLPIVTDPNDYSTTPVKTDDSKIHFIYPGNPYKKDSLVDMIKGISLLDKYERDKVVFHLTGMKKSTVDKILGKDKNLIENSPNWLNIHGWMEYDELKKLYAQCSFVLLARPKNKVTISNFPSKIPELTACGIIPIINKVGDVAEYLTDGIDSILYENCDPVEIKQSIQRCLSLSEEEIFGLRCNARQCTEKQFKYSAWSKYLAEFIDKK